MNEAETTSTKLQTDNPIPKPPFWGSRVVEQVPLTALVPYINRTALYKVQWGFKPKGKSKEEYKQWARTEVDPILNRLVHESVAQNILQPQAVYGYFPAQADGEELIVYAAPDSKEERCRFPLPRQTKNKKRCITDFFCTVESGEMDVLPLQLVTVGQSASDFARELFTTDQYQEYLYWHGLNAEGAEGLAEYIHRMIRSELGFAMEDAREIQEMIKQKYRGARFSFGYPACPDLSEQHKIIELLGAERIGVQMSEDEQLWPEESTSAIVVHHPQGHYFSV